MGYTNLEKIHVCACIWKTDKLFRKKKRSWLDATKVDGMLLGEGERVKGRVDLRL